MQEGTKSLARFAGFITLPSLKPQGGEAGYRAAIGAAVPQLQVLDDLALQSVRTRSPPSPTRQGEWETDLNMVHSSLRLSDQESTEQGMRVGLWIHTVCYLFVISCSAVAAVRPKTAPAQSECVRFYVLPHCLTCVFGSNRRDGINTGGQY